MLTDLAVKSAKASDKPTKMSDSDGLYLHIMPTGSKVWRYDYRFDGKRKTATFGHYPQVKLSDARSERDKFRLSLKGGADPMAKTESTKTFKVVAEEWFDGKSKTWETSYSRRFWSRLEKNILPKIGHKLINEIEAPDVLEALREIENRDAAYSAKRIRQMVSTVFSFAISSGYTKLNPAVSLGAALKPTPKVKHRAALKESDLPDFFRKLRAYGGEPQTKLGLELVAHTFVRTDEIRFATWDEISEDFWRIPGERMKNGKDHIIPLSRQVKAILKEMRAVAGTTKWLISTNGKPVSENCLLFACYGLGYHGKATVHGLRGTASTILNESGLWRPDAIERQLSHVPENQVRSAYNAALYMDERVPMMQWYSDLLERHEHGLLV